MALAVAPYGTPRAALSRALLERPAPDKNSLMSVIFPDIVRQRLGPNMAATILERRDSLSVPFVKEVVDALGPGVLERSGKPDTDTYVDEKLAPPGHTKIIDNQLVVTLEGLAHIAGGLGRDVGREFRKAVKDLKDNMSLILDTFNSQRDQLRQISKAKRRQLVNAADEHGVSKGFMNHVNDVVHTSVLGEHACDALKQPDKGLDQIDINHIRKRKFNMIGCTNTGGLLLNNVIYSSTKNMLDVTGFATVADAKNEILDMAKSAAEDHRSMYEDDNGDVDFVEVRKDYLVEPAQLFKPLHN